MSDSTVLPWAIEIAKFGLAFVPLALIPVMIFLERKGAGVIQDRPGPNRSAISIFGFKIRGFGMVHNFSDVVKLLWKEDFIPKYAHRWYYLLAPLIPVFTAVITPALIPWFAPITDVGAETISGQILNVDDGLLLLFAVSSLSVFGVVLGSWGSNSKYSLLGGLRSSAMMISYEVSMGLSVLGLILIIGSWGLTDIVTWQEEYTWGLIVQPIGFLLFVVSMFAETGRTPFDVAEGESEIVGGFHTEYSSMKFALFFMGEYAHIVIASALMAVVFCGGYDLLPWPGTGTDFIKSNLGLVIGIVAIAKGLLLLGIGKLILNQKKRYATFKATDHDAKAKEYGLFSGIFGLAGIGGLIIGLAALIFSGSIAEWDAAITSILTAGVQLGVVIGKTLFFCWLFVWVRWTLPRIRYDQIMALGWKVMLNVALVNLLITALIVKVING